MSDDDHLDEFNAFFRQYEKRLRGYVRSRGVAAASIDDVVQESMFVTFRHWVRLRSSHPKAFLYEVARNAALEQVKRDAPAMPPISIDATSTDLPASQSDIDGYADLLADRELLKALLGRLPPRQRETLRLRLLEGFSVKETAKIMNVTAGTVTSQTCSGWKALKDLAGHGDDGITKEVDEQ
jgi:RNA polymerase sigma factor (sigma-70 family)